MTVTSIGDLHYLKLEHRIPNFNKLLTKTLRTTLNEAAKRGTSHVVIVGDIFDNPFPTQAAMIEFNDVVTDFSDMEFIVIPGNHDYSDVTTDSLMMTKWTRKLKSNIRVISKPEMIKIDGVRYYFMPHPFIQDMPTKADYGFAHFAANGARGDNGFTVRTKNQPKGNWILGDFHTEQQGKSKGCIYDYVGSLTQLSWEEKARKTVISIEDGEKHRRKVDLAYKLVKHTVESDDQLDEIKFEKDSYYYIKTKNGYVLPKGWVLDHPQVVRQSAVASKKDRRAEVLTPDETFIHPLANLEPYLLSKKVDASVVARAVELANTLQVGNAA